MNGNFCQCSLLTAIRITVAILVMSAAVSGADAQQIERSSGHVVKLFGAGIGNLDSYGSGTLISSEGHVITVWNHLINTGYLTAVTADGQRFSLKVIGTSADHDLAVLQLVTREERSFPFVDLSQMVRPASGTEVRAYSNMFHVATGNEPVSVVHGIVAADAKLSAGFGRWNFPLDSHVLILDAITNNSGAAGGLVTDLQGRPAGLLGRELRHHQSGTWVNYAVPFETLKPVVDTILSGGTIDRSSDDTTTPPLSDLQLTSVWGMTLLPEILRETPAYLDRVIPNSLAEQAGLQRGDLVVLVNEEVIQTGYQLRQELAKIRSGLRVVLTVNRKGALHTVRLRVP